MPRVSSPPAAMTHPLAAGNKAGSSAERTRHTPSSAGNPPTAVRLEADHSAERCPLDPRGDRPARRIRSLGASLQLCCAGVATPQISAPYRHRTGGPLRNGLTHPGPGRPHGFVNPTRRPRSALSTVAFAVESCSWFCASRFPPRLEGPCSGSQWELATQRAGKAWDKAVASHRGVGGG
eukprot:scaffold389_cov382-Prasinococcus_capsulatus_cf.AAC.15